MKTVLFKMQTGDKFWKRFWLKLDMYLGTGSVLYYDSFFLVK